VYGRCQVVGGVAAGAGVQGVGIGDEGNAPGLFDRFHHLADVHRANERRIAHLPEMDFYRRQIPFFDGRRHACGFHQPSDFGDKVLFDRGPHIDKIDVAGHGILHWQSFIIRVIRCTGRQSPMRTIHLYTML
jgi:hypothetical protein